jgi:hypothetical protein
MLAHAEMQPEQSHDAVAIAVADRRSSSRICTVYFVVKITREDDAGLFRVRNISDDGMMLATHVNFSCRERVTIELAHDLVVQGTVAWCREGCCGVEFDEPIDCAAVLRQRTDEKLNRRGHALRLPVCRLATCYSETGIRSVTVSDVSRRGVGLIHGGSIAAGMSVKLVLESGTARTGVVRWSNNGHAGVRLDEPLTCEEMESAKHL